MKTTNQIRFLQVAIKTLRPGIMQREDFLAEAAIIRSLHHENLIQLYAVCTLEEPIYIVTEYMHRGSLLDYLQKGDGCKLVESELINIGAQVQNDVSPRISVMTGCVCVYRWHLGWLIWNYIAISTDCWQLKMF